MHRGNRQRLGPQQLHLGAKVPVPGGGIIGKNRILLGKIGFHREK
jgi:hypothetical protein